MLKKILAAVLVSAASFSFMPTSGASAVDNNNYCCGNYYDNGCCDYYDGERGNYGSHYRGGRGCCH